MTAVQFIRQVRRMLGAPTTAGDLSSQARAAGLNAETVRSRLKRGWSAVEAFNVSTKTRAGIPWGQLAKRARKAGLRPKTVKARIHAGWSLRRALSTPHLGWGGARPRKRGRRVAA